MKTAKSILVVKTLEGLEFPETKKEADSMIQSALDFQLEPELYELEVENENSKEEEFYEKFGTMGCIQIGI